MRPTAVLGSELWTSLHVAQRRTDGVLTPSMYITAMMINQSEDQSLNRLIFSQEEDPRAFAKPLWGGAVAQPVIWRADPRHWGELPSDTRMFISTRLGPKPATHYSANEFDAMFPEAATVPHVPRRIFLARALALGSFKESLCSRIRAN